MSIAKWRKLAGAFQPSSNDTYMAFGTDADKTSHTVRAYLKLLLSLLKVYKQSLDKPFKDRRNRRRGRIIHRSSHKNRIDIKPCAVT